MKKSKALVDFTNKVVEVQGETKFSLIFIKIGFDELLALEEIPDKHDGIRLDSDTKKILGGLKKIVENSNEYRAGLRELADN